MKRILILILWFSPMIISAQIELNLGGGVNYNLGYLGSRAFGPSSGGLWGRMAEISGAYRESEDWYYRLALSGVENVWSDGFERQTRIQNKTRFRYLNIMPQAEYLPGKVIGFTGGLYFGFLLSEENFRANSGGWTKNEDLTFFRKLEPGIMLGTTLYIGSISLGVHWTRGLLPMERQTTPPDPLSSFVQVHRFNSGVQVKMGYFFTLVED